MTSSPRSMSSLFIFTDFFRLEKTKQEPQRAETLESSHDSLYCVTSGSLSEGTSGFNGVDVLSLVLIPT